MRESFLNYIPSTRLGNGEERGRKNYLNKRWREGSNYPVEAVPAQVFHSLSLSKLLAVATLRSTSDYHDPLTKQRAIPYYFTGMREINSPLNNTNI